jgi:hypothetical protein
VFAQRWGLEGKFSVSAKAGNHCKLDGNQLSCNFGGPYLTATLTVIGNFTVETGSELHFANNFKPSITGDFTSYGETIADLIAVIGSVDYILPDIDR